MGIQLKEVYEVQKKKGTKRIDQKNRKNLENIINQYNIIYGIVAYLENCCRFSYKSNGNLRHSIDPNFQQKLPCTASLIFHVM